MHLNIMYTYTCLYIYIYYKVYDYIAKWANSRSLQVSCASLQRKYEHIIAIVSLVPYYRSGMTCYCIRITHFLVMAIRPHGEIKLLG